MAGAADVANAGDATGGADSAGASSAASATELEQLLDRLVEAGLLSNERFAESLVHRRAPVRGAAVIRHELRAHGLSDDAVAQQVQALEASEFDRAHALWQRRFGTTADTPKDRARQMRFLLARGFAPDVVRKVIGGQAPDDPA